jgi:hypothetical protein
VKEREEIIVRGICHSFSDMIVPMVLQIGTWR